MEKLCYHILVGFIACVFYLFLLCLFPGRNLEFKGTVVAVRDHGANFTHIYICTFILKFVCQY